MNSGISPALAQIHLNKFHPKNSVADEWHCFETGKNVKKKKSKTLKP